MAFTPASQAKNGRLFSSGQPTAQWSQFSAHGYAKPVTGNIYRKDFRPVCGAPLGSVDTGALDIESDGSIGYSSIFNDLSPRGGPVNQPMFGIAISGKTWVLATGTTKNYDGGNIPPMPGGNAVPLSEGSVQTLTTADDDWQGMGPAVAIGPDAFPVVLKSVRDQKIFRTGDFGGHTPAVQHSTAYGDFSWIRWTAPAAMTIAMQGGVWSNFEDRTCDFVVRLRGEDVWGGLRDGKLGRHTIAGTATSAAPESFALQGLRVAAGDEVLLAFRTNGNQAYPGMGTFFGLRARITAGDQTWDLTRDWDGVATSAGPWSFGATIASGVVPPSPDMPLTGVGKASEIEYWGHYPVIDMEYTTDAPVQVGTRLWSPFLPGDLKASNTPGSVIQVHLRNTTKQRQQGTFLFSFPGLGAHRSLVTSTGFPNLAAIPQPPPSQLSRTLIDSPKLRGIHVKDAARQMEFAIGAIGTESIATGAGLAADGARWAAAAQGLPAASADDDSASLGVPFDLEPGATRVVNLVLAWYAPVWDGNGTPFCDSRKFTHMYASHYKDAAAVADYLATNHASFLDRIIAWQSVLYADPATPGWLADSLINKLYLIPECSVWAQAKPPVGDWCRPEDGVYGHVESPRSCPQIECLPVTAISGIVPMIYFFPETMLSCARAWKSKQLPTGQMQFAYGLYWEMDSPHGAGNQEVMNGGNYMAILDRYYTVTKDTEFIKEFYDSAKKACQFSFSQRANYGDEQIVAMPTPIEGSYNFREWFEDREWKGYVAHPGGYRLAQAEMIKRWAEIMGDKEYIIELDRLIAAGKKAMEEKLWNGRFYDASNEPESGYHLDFWFTPQINGQLYARGSGLPGVFPPERIASVLACLPKVCAISKFGIPPNTASADFTAGFKEKYKNEVIGAGYLSGVYNFTPSQVYMTAQICMYEGQIQLGLDILKRIQENEHVRWGAAWEAWNAVSGKADDGSRAYGTDYNHNLILWNTHAALANQDVAGPLQDGGIMRRLLDAAKARP